MTAESSVASPRNDPGCDRGEVMNLAAQKKRLHPRAWPGAALARAGAFLARPEAVLVSVLHDLSESGLVFVLGSGGGVAYRAASDEELGELARSGAEDGLEELIWALGLHEGPFGEAELGRRVARARVSSRRRWGRCSPTVAWSGARTASCRA